LVPAWYPYSDEKPEGRKEKPLRSGAFLRVSDGIRTRDRRDHNPELYQLSYAHQADPNLAGRAYSDRRVAERNVDIVRNAIEAFNHGDVEAVLALAAEDIEVYTSRDMANAGRFRGHEGFLNWMGQWLEAWDEFTVVLLEVETIDDRHVLAIARQMGRGALSGIEIDMEVAQLFEIAPDGQIVRFQLHLQREDALAEVGSGAG
jgi:ketosteroid isomerase-like protein